MLSSFCSIRFFGSVGTRLSYLLYLNPLAMYDLQALLGTLLR